MPVTNALVLSRKLKNERKFPSGAIRLSSYPFSLAEDFFFPSCVCVCVCVPVEEHRNKRSKDKSHVEIQSIHPSCHPFAIKLCHTS